MGQSTLAAEPARLTQEEELHWLALRMIPGLGARGSLALIERFKSPVSIFRASRTELEAAGASGSAAQSIASGCTFDEAVDQQSKMRNAGAQLIPLTDPRYPAALKEIYDPPPMLFARGRLELLDEVILGVVGTRRPTPYGNAVAERFSADLATAGAAVASGMARGIDTAAHKGALAVGGDTLAVFGCGVDVLYPAENRNLANELAAKGLILSEFPMGSSAFPQNFPVRNRIISGMAVGVLVVEGAQYSGSGITARLAMDQGREVFAIPGNITSKASWGPNLLIKQGAKLVQDVEDILSELPPAVRRRLALKVSGTAELPPATQPGLPLAQNTPLARWVLARLEVGTATQIDQLLDNLEEGSPSELIATLFELEMLGLVRQLPGKSFVKVW
jgi:DNA processing protein